jgi:hypothetical protein
MVKQREFRVDISRPLRPIQNINGLEVYQDSQLNYVDCYFPDGTQRTWGYIGRTPPKGAQFAPLAGCSQGLSDAIQSEINRLLECAPDEAAPPPVMIDEQLDGDDDQEESEDE